MKLICGPSAAAPLNPDRAGRALSLLPLSRWSELFLLLPIPLVVVCGSLVRRSSIRAGPPPPRPAAKCSVPHLWPSPRHHRKRAPHERGRQASRRSISEHLLFCSAFSLTFAGCLSIRRHLNKTLVPRVSPPPVELGAFVCPALVRLEFASARPCGAFVSWLSHSSCNGDNLRRLNKQLPRGPTSRNSLSRSLATSAAR